MVFPCGSCSESSFSRAVLSIKEGQEGQEDRKGRCVEMESVTSSR